MSIGVLLFATAGDRLKGDPGYPGTFEFPVEYGIVEGSYRDLIEGSPDACRRLCEAAKKLAKKKSGKNQRWVDIYSSTYYYKGKDGTEYM